MSFYLSVPGVLSNDNARNFALVYLFLSVNRRITDDEMGLFCAIGREYDGWSEAKPVIIGKCEELLAGENGRYQVIAKTFTEAADGIYDGTGRTQRLLLSWFIELMCQSGTFAGQRLDLTNLWLKESKIDQSVFDEMKDIAETALVLEKQREWVSFLGDSFSDSESVLSEIEKNLRETAESLSNLVALG